MEHRTPLRYPGGKQRLAPFILELMVANGLTGGDYAEPYAGGGGVAIELLLTGKVAKIHLNDSCDAIYSFWFSILNQTEEFCKRIQDTPLDIETWKKQREIVAQPTEFDTLDVGFSTFYLNRCNRSGIIAGGGVIGGLKQNGKWKMDARFPQKKLIGRIVAIAERKNSISVTHLNAEIFISENVPLLSENTLVYCDPPYFKKAHGLYFNHYEEKDHARIAKIIQRMNRPWVVSYDTVPKILHYYSKWRRVCYRLQHTAAAARKGKEVFFFSDGLAIPTQSQIPFVNRALKRVASANPTRFFQGRNRVPPRESAFPRRSTKSPCMARERALQ